MLTSNDLVNYIKKQTQSHLIQLNELIHHDLTAIADLLQAAGISKNKVSSFTTSAAGLQELKYQLEQTEAHTKSSSSLDNLKTLLKQDNQNLIITVDPAATPRLLYSNSTKAESKIFNDIGPFSLSGLFVGLFLLVMLMIGVCCLMDLKTNDRFARDDLWIGREN